MTVLNELYRDEIRIEVLKAEIEKLESRLETASKELKELMEKYQKGIDFSD